MKVPLRYLVLFVTLVLVPVLIAAQTDRTLGQDRPLHLRSNLVEIRAVVTDRKGMPVEELNKGSFEVLENGKAQDVAFFSFEKITPASSMPEAIRRDGHQLSSKPKRTVLIFADTVHLSSENLLCAKLAIGKFINEQIQDDDLVAVMSSGGPMGLVNQFTCDKRILQYAVEKLAAWGVSRSLFTPYLAYLVTTDPNPNDPQGATSAARDILTAEEGIAVGPGLAAQREIQLRARSILSEAAWLRGATLWTLDAAIEQMGDIPGQRIVLFISEGFSLQGNAGNAHGDLNRVTSRAVRSGILVYSIDARGLSSDASLDASHRMPVSPSVYRYVSDSIKDTQGSINAIARDTGGDAFFNNNDMTALMATALNANAVYYSLAYYSTESGTGYRRLSLSVRGHPDYKIRAQKGYYQPPAIYDRNLTKQTPQKNVTKALTMPLPQTDIGVAAAAYYIERDLDDAQVSVEVFIDGATLNYRQKDGRQALDCDLTTVIFDQNGKSTKVVTDKVQGLLTREQVEDGKKNGYRYVKRFSLKPGIYQVRIAVSETGSARVGTANAWIEVPDLARSKLALSSIVLTAISPAAGDQQPGIKLLPPAVRQGIYYFKQGTSLAYQLTVYGTSVRNRERLDLLIQSEITQRGTIIYRSEWQSVRERLIRSGGKGLDLGGRINLDLNPGVYQLHISVKDPKANHQAQQARIFEIGI